MVRKYGLPLMVYQSLKINAKTTENNLKTVTDLDQEL